jgi:PAT family beta-lactamase induction signal transducer AmpG
MVTDRPHGSSLYANRTMVVLLALGLSGGIPNLLATSVVPAWTTDVGWSIEAIGYLSLLQFPYALKFLWAPCVDRIALPMHRRLGQRRVWLLWSQLAIALLILALGLWQPAGVDPSSSVHVIIFAALLAALTLFSATQDIVADAFRAESLEPSQLGAGAGVFVSGYRVAFVALGALALALAPAIGWTMVFAGMGLIASACVGGTLAAREPERRVAPEPGLRGAVVAPFMSLWRIWGIRLFALVMFVLLFRLPDQLGNAMTTPLLLKGLGYTTAQLGWVRQGFGFTLTIVGALVGGWMVARLGIVRCLVAFGVVQAGSNGGFLVLAELYGATTQAAPSTPPSLVPLMGVIAVENFAGGLVSAGFVAFLMSVCDRAVVATQYALLTALMAASGAIAGSLSGILTRELDYPAFFLLTIFAGAPGLALIPFIRSRSCNASRVVRS